MRMVSTANTSTSGSAEVPSRINANYDLAFRMQQQHQRQQHDWDEEAQDMSMEASEISTRLVAIRRQLVTISDKTSSAVVATGSDISDNEVKMAMEAQTIMKRLGEIKASLSRKKKSIPNLSRDSSLGRPSKRVAEKGELPVWKKPPSVLPSAVSLGTTPCMSASSSATPGFFNVTEVSSSSSLQEQPSIPALLSTKPEELTCSKVPAELEQREGVPSSPLAMSPINDACNSPSRVNAVTPKDKGYHFPGRTFLAHKSNNVKKNAHTYTNEDSFSLDDQEAFSFSDHPKVVPWGRGSPGRIDHGIGVIVKSLRSVPSLEPIESLDDTSSSELSSIPAADDTSVNAFDYPLTKPSCHPEAIPTTSLLDDTFLDTSSIEDLLDAAEQGVVGMNKGNSPGGSKSFKIPSLSCQTERIMDFFVCGSQQLFEGSREKEQSLPISMDAGENGCCIDKAACGVPEAAGSNDYSVTAFLQSLRLSGR